MIQVPTVQDSPEANLLKEGVSSGSFYLHKVGTGPWSMIYKHQFCGYCCCCDGILYFPLIRSPQSPTPDTIEGPLVRLQVG